MDASAISSLIGSLGFPIAACIYMAVFVERQQKEHKEEVSKLTEALTDMKLAIAELTAYLKK